MRIIPASDRAALDALLLRDSARDEGIASQAAAIVDDVRTRGDAALKEWTRTLDRTRSDIQEPVSIAAIGRDEMKRGWNSTSAAVRRALKVAATHLRAVARRQVPRPFTVMLGSGHRVEQRVQPLGRVGCYVPGGRYPLPSTLLMTVVPARAAGVDDVVVVCPKPTPVVLAAAFAAGADAIYPVGGAQAIGALAYGTNTVPRVDKIVGPGNAWVAAAKSLVAADCPIDLHAGPSEIVVCSTRGRADWIAADLIAQAEHDPAARAILITTSKRLAAAVTTAVEAAMPSEGPAAEAIETNGGVVVAQNRREAIALVNRFAPEHLVIDEDDSPDLYRTAGTIFVGNWSVQAAGDYCTGSNHVLPTGGAGRFRGGLSAADFVRVFSVQTLSERALKRIGPAAATLADAEGLAAHAASIRARL
jgi:histidinol dehydrogenase